MEDLTEAQIRALLKFEDGFIFVSENARDVCCSADIYTGTSFVSKGYGGGLTREAAIKAAWKDYCGKRNLDGSQD